jgi:hypothetical protein
MINQIGARLTFENAKSFVQSQGYDVSQAVLTQSYVRSEVAISSSVTNYRLPIVVTDTTNGASAFNTERRVALQDVHVVSSLFIGLAAPSSSTDAAFPVLSYPSTGTNQFSSAQADAALTLYNGFLTMQVNNQNILPAWDILRHYYVPQTQGGVGITAQTVFPIDQWDAADNGFYPVEPNILLNGGANIVANIVLPAAISSVAANSRIVAIFRSILCQNVTSVK